MASFKRAGGRFVYDPSEEEELGGDERIHITLGDEGHLHSLQKGLKESSLRTNLPRFLRSPNKSAVNYEKW